MEPSFARPYDLILFDLDGTLVDTAPEIADAVNDSLAANGFARVSLAQVRDWIGRGSRELMIQAISSLTAESLQVTRQSNRLAPVLRHFEDCYARRCGTRSTLFPRVHEVLQTLRGRGVRLAVVTNKSARFARAILDAHSLTQLFEVVVSGDSLPTIKPDPTGVNTCIELFATPHERTLFVGDSSIDVATARAAGVAIWVVPYGYNQGKPIVTAAPDKLIPDLSALLP